MIEGDDLLNIGFYKINDRWFKWENSNGKIYLIVYLYEDKPFDVDLMIDNYFDHSRTPLHNIKTLNQIKNLIKALEGEE